MHFAQLEWIYSEKWQKVEEIRSWLEVGARNPGIKYGRIGSSVPPSPPNDLAATIVKLSSATQRRHHSMFHKIGHKGRQV